MFNKDKFTNKYRNLIDSIETIPYYCDSAVSEILCKTMLAVAIVNSYEKLDDLQSMKTYLDNILENKKLH